MLKPPVSRLLLISFFLFCVLPALAVPRAGFVITGIPGRGDVTATEGMTVRICTGTTLNFKDASTYSGVPIQAVTYRYNGVNYSSFPGGTRPVTYTQNGTTVQEVTDYEGRKDSLKINIIVSSNYPDAAFTVNTATDRCGYNDFTFTGTAPSAGLSYNWAFSGSATETSTANPATIKFNEAVGNSTGLYPVTLTVTNTDGCQATQTQNVQVKQVPGIHVTSGGTAPDIYNGLPTFKGCNVTYPYEFTFFNNSSTSNTNYSIAWPSGSYNGNNWPAAGIPHSFPEGYSSFTVSVTGANGCSTDSTYQVYVSSRSEPAAGISSGVTGLSCAPVIFSFNIAYQENSKGTIYKFLVNDGSQPKVFQHEPPGTISHEFLKSSCGTTSTDGNRDLPNSFQATIQVDNACGTKSASVVPLYISAKPSAVIDMPQADCINNTISIRNAGNFGSVASAGGCDNTGKQVWQIKPLTGTAGGIDFPAGDMGSLGGNITNVSQWVTGKPVLTGRFTEPGTYVVTMYAGSLNGCGIDSTKDTICIRNIPQATFSLNSKAICAPGTVKATKTSAANAACGGEDYSWVIRYLPVSGCSGTPGFTFTDSSYSGASINFTQPGRYELTLRIAAKNSSSASACSAVYKDTILVGIKPGAAFTGPLAAICTSDSIRPSLKMDSCFSKGPVKYKWVFDGGLPASSTVSSPGFIRYETAGKFAVKVTVSNDCGDTTVIDSIIVTGQPQVNSIKDTAICSGSSVGLQLGSPTPGVAYSWNSTVLTPGAVSGNTSLRNQQSATIEDILVNTASPAAPVKVEYLIWSSVPSGVCTSDTIKVTVTVQPIEKADAGNDQFLCSGQITTNLAAGPLPTGATGQWLQVGGPTLVIADKTNPATAVSNFTSGQNYRFVWEIAVPGALCVQPTDTVNISTVPVTNVIDTPSSSICDGSQVTLTGKPVSGGNGQYRYQWQQSSNCVAYADISGAISEALTLTPQAGYCYRRIIFSGNCSDTSNIISVPVTTIRPSPSFSPSDTSGCGPLNISFTNTTAPDAALFTYSWNFGNGVTSTAIQPGEMQFAINSNGYSDTVYKVLLKASNGCVTVDSDTAYITVKSKPKASFSPDRSSGCSAMDVVFTNNSAGSVTAYTWLFGDGSPASNSTANKVTHRYTTGVSTVYTAQLAAQNTCGADTARVSIVVNPNTIDLHLAVNGNQQYGCSGQQVDFINNTRGANVFRWNFGDPASGAANTLVTAEGLGTVPHVFSGPGIYTVTLCAGNGCTLDTCTTVTIEVKDKPTAAFTATPSSLCVGDVVSFQNNSLPGSGLSFAWTFGDDSTSNALHPSHLYQRAGSYTAQLVASLLYSQGFSCSDTATALLTVGGPSGILSYPDTICVNTAADFTVQGENTLEYRFYFGNGDSAITTTPFTTYTYRQAGTFQPYVVLVQGGCRRMVTGAHPVWIDSVQAAFAYDSDPYCDSTVLRFRDASVAGTGIASIAWTIDGLRYTGSTASATIQVAGNYQVSMQATALSGCQGIYTQTLPVTVHTTPSGIISAQDAGCSNTPYTFTAAVYASDSLSHTWDFGNGQTLTGSPVYPVYAQAGTYRVRLISRTGFGCRDTLYKTIAVHPSPLVTATGGGRICLGGTAQLVASGSGVTNWNWSPVDSLSCPTCNTTLAVPSSSTTYTVTGTNTFGCSGTDSVAVQVVQPFVLQLSPGDTAICLNQQLSLSASGGATYSWSPANWLSDASIPNPVFSPPQNLTTHTQFPITVTSHDAYNCFSDTRQLTITVGILPRVELGTGDSGVAGRQFIIHPVSSGGPFRQFSWRVISGQGTVNCLGQAACAEPQLTITTDVAFEVTAENLYGCTAKDTVYYKAFCSQDAQLFLPNAFSPDGDQVNDVFMVQGRGIIVETFRVYNRWGQLVFDAGSNFNPNRPERGWSGRLAGGQQATQDVYTYITRVKCTASGETYTKRGDVTLIRVSK